MLDIPEIRSRVLNGERPRIQSWAYGSNRMSDLIQTSWWVSKLFSTFHASAFFVFSSIYQRIMLSHELNLRVKLLWRQLILCDNFPSSSIYLQFFSELHSIFLYITLSLQEAALSVLWKILNELSSTQWHPTLEVISTFYHLSFYLPWIAYITILTLKVITIIYKPISCNLT